jgi:hypothetical protein
MWRRWRAVEATDDDKNRINIMFEYYDVDQSNYFWFVPLKIRAKTIRLT